ncbi:MAG: 3-hydroxyacyl-[acyl-carrier-protein] dehydratase FabZ [Chloroflexi bacterium RBG_13_54_9]|jgi:3-hydroxyacyl-[acyl-carrier-protein] dehydratase|nr:MAG: 3-hydroxyacyl-[acyl-carrier-protein] dehydratase FabZ [Chloroflexi bacterium RBG_13_54_9]
MTLGAREIQQIIPHRWPFLLVDKIVEMESGVRAVGIKNVSVNEPFFQGHFPGQPIMPGVLIVEALAQVGAVALLSQPENKGKLVFFAGIDSFRFRRPVLPGDTLRLEVHLTKMRGPVGKGSAKAEVEGQKVAEGELTFALADAERLL